jgi:hypothetical protein
MNMNPTLRTVGLAAIMLCAAAVQANADDADATDQTQLPDGDLSLLGQVFGTLTYTHINLSGTSSRTDGYTFEMNQPLAFGLDGVFGYDFLQSGVVAGNRTKQHALGVALRAFSTSFNWGKPYVEAGGGYVWNRRAGASDNSYAWQVAAGAEFQVISRATLTPYVQYADMPDLAGEGVWNVGVKGNYWIDSAWAVTTGIERDGEQNMAFTVGTNFRY